MITKQNYTRRKFFSKSAIILGGTYASLNSAPFINNIYGWVNNRIQTDFKHELYKNSPAARYWISTAQKNNCQKCHSPAQISGKTKHDHEEIFVKCVLCAQGCIIKENDHGKCRARININGNLKSLVYGRPISIHVDPIEKKPFYHFLPGSNAYSLATAGCPLSCQFCQNWELSQARPEDYPVQYISPFDIASDSKTKNVPVIAFTYNEPTVFFEYMIDIAREAKKKSIRSVLISCGFMNSEPLRELCENLDAIKIDLKGFSEDFYRKVCAAELKPVLQSIKQIAKSKTHLEIVNLVVPTLNDSDKMLDGLCDWVAGEIGPNVPIHFTRFHPDYKLLNLPPTPISTLERARDIAMQKGINYAFVGNVPGHKGNCTYCPSCKKMIVKRSGMFTEEVHIKNNKCEYCNQVIAGVWK